jgi:hypothetical protein
MQGGSVNAKLSSLVAILAVVGLLGLGTPVQAQETGAAKISWGAQAGLNLGKLSGSTVSGESKKFHPGLRVGAFVEYPLQDMFAVSGGVLFNMKGVKFDDDGTVSGEPGTYTAKLNYLSIPVLAKVKFTSAGASLTPYIFAGPELGILLQAKDKSEPTSGGSTEIDVKDYTKSTEFGIDLGAGLEMPFSDMVGLIEAGYDLGLTDTVKNPPAGADKVKTQTLHVEVGIRF